MTVGRSFVVKRQKPVGRHAATTVMKLRGWTAKKTSEERRKSMRGAKRVRGFMKKKPKRKKNSGAERLANKE